jgi:PKD repeat protein
MGQRLVAFKDLSEGEITSWKWDFGDGTSSTEQNPTHQYPAKPGREGIYTVVLYVTGPDGTSRMAKVWQVHVRG